MDRIDHLVLTVKDLGRSVRFYVENLGLEPITFGDGRIALAFGRNKINLHQKGAEIEPRAQSEVLGAADFCLITDTSLDEVIHHLRVRNVPIELGPVERVGALGKMGSIYIRDPDGNLVEISVYGDDETATAQASA